MHHPVHPLEVDPKSLRASLGAIEVNLEQATVKPFEYYIHATGKVSPQHKVEVRAKTTGIVEQLYLVNGQVVKKRSVLLVLAHDQQRLAVEKATTQLNISRVKYESDLLAFGDEERLNDQRGKIIKENIHHSSGMATSEVSLKEAQLALSYTEISSEISGMVSDLEIQMGNEVKIGDIICTVYNPDKLLIETEVLESEVGKLQIGQKADLQTIANPYKTYKASLTVINPSVDTETGMLKIKLAINNSQGLLPGMNASVRIKVPYNNHIIIAKEAVVLRSGKPVVFTMEDNLAKWNYVTLGNENGKEVEILEGLKEDQQVIVSNNLQLAHDAPVKQLVNMK
jgi:RND family efflux transporter MFP subunit